MPNKYQTPRPYCRILGYRDGAGLTGPEPSTPPQITDQTPPPAVSTTSKPATKKPAENTAPAAGTFTTTKRGVTRFNSLDLKPMDPPSTAEMYSDEIPF